MGTAIEMWEAHQHGAAVITISPLKHNWAVKFLSHALYADEAQFEAALRKRRDWLLSRRQMGEDWRGRAVTPSLALMHDCGVGHTLHILPSPPASACDLCCHEFLRPG